MKLIAIYHNEDSTRIAQLYQLDDGTWNVKTFYKADPAKSAIDYYTTSKPIAVSHAMAWVKD